MEIPVINRIGDFEALQNPSFLSQSLALTCTGVEKIHQAYGFWKWGALILALVASFSTIMNKIKILIIQIQDHYLLPSQPHINQQLYNSDSDSDMSCSSSYSTDDEEDETDDEEDESVTRRASTSTSAYSWKSSNEDFSVKGSSSAQYIDGHQWYNSNLRKRRNNSLEDIFSSLAEFKNGKNVVKLWDNLGFGFRLNVQNNSRNCVSLYDMNKELNFFSIFGEKSYVPAVSTSSSSPSVIVSGDTNASGQLLRVWDTRVGGRIPEILAEWKPRLGKFVGIGNGGGGVEKVYIRDDVTGRLAVGDLRNIQSPLVNATETDVDTWWDADGAIDDGKED